LALVLGASILIFSTPGSAVKPDETAYVPAEKPPDEVAVVPPPAPEPPKEEAVPHISIITETETLPPPAVTIEPVIEAPKKPAPPPKKPAPAKAAPAYWVQIGSYTQKSGADKVKQNLNERGLASVITNGDVQGKTYYRVRIGPYISQAEADYWLKLVRSIDGFEKSQVWKAGA
jgi:DedD protein